MGTDSDLRNAMCEVGRRLYARNLIAGSDGNISVRIDGGRFLCTPSGFAKGFLKPGELVVADAQGEKISGEGAVSSEFLTHLEAYRQRPDINAVVHAHPPHAVALSLLGVSFEDPVLPELVYSLGAVPTAAYATPGTPEGAQVVQNLFREHEAVILPRHGALTVGRDLFKAYARMETIEHAAQTLLMAHLLGPLPPLNPAQVERIVAARPIPE